MTGCARFCGICDRLQSDDCATCDEIEAMPLEGIEIVDEVQVELAAGNDWAAIATALNALAVMVLALVLAVRL